MANGIQIIWEYTVKEEYLKEFIEVYSSNGNWAKLFKKCLGYKQTQLKQSLTNNRTFITIDYWDSLSSYSSMKVHIKNEYESLDQECELYTKSEKMVGIFAT